LSAGRSIRAGPDYGVEGAGAQSKDRSRYEAEVTAKGVIWLEARWADKLSAMRGKGESYSNTPTRLT
jgi:hypothetical protein